MELIQISSQLVIGLGLLNVWLLRSSKSTLYRGGEAKNLKQEFEVYGLPQWSFYLVGFLKVSAGLVLVAGIWFPPLIRYAASLIALLMLGALSMHLKVGDPIRKSIPALILFTGSMVLVISTW